MSKRILVVDRSRTIQTLLSTYLRNAGHQVITRSTSQDALQVLAVFADVPDLIFLAIDYQKTAYQVIQYVQAHAQYAHTRFVAMVLQEEKADILRTLKGANVRYLVKPFSIQDALALVGPESSGVSAQCEMRTGERGEGR
ncbi:MAG: response regulator [Chloroflexi bacterium]|nr:response regulator [Chloroflexota bacterium]